MKQPNSTFSSDKNWTWPQQTWFQQRLNAIKAQENEARRAQSAIPQKPIVTEGKSDDKKTTNEA